MRAPRVLTLCVAAVAIGAFAGAGGAQPRITRVGGGLTAAVTSDGTKLASGGSVLTIGNTVTQASLPGFSIDAATASFSFFAGTNASGAARWNAQTGTAQGLGLFTSPAPSTGTPAVRDISDDGRYICGWTYLADGAAFRPWVWDATAAGGAGQMVSLPTTANGQAKLVGLDGTVAGVDSCCGSANRPVIWRRNAGTGSWEESYLPFDAGVTGGDVYAMNSAGTVIVGSIGRSTGSIDIARWTWNAATQSWSRLTIPISAIVRPTWLGATYNPTQMIPTAVTDDGNTIVGITVYTFFSSFQRGGFTWKASTGLATDFYDDLVAAQAPNITAFGAEPDSPPALGFPIAISGDGQHIATYAGPQTGFGPPLLIDLGGGPCVSPSATAVNSTTSVAAGSSAFLNTLVTGSEPMTIQWRFNSGPIVDGPSGTGSTYYGATGRGTIGVQLVITQTSPADTGTYDCVVSNGCGAATRPPLTLTVNQGACCAASGTGGDVVCVVQGSSRCTGSVSVGGLGGVYLGDSTTCTPSACGSVLGACCYWSGSSVACILDISVHCTLAQASGGNGGSFLGTGTSCSPDPVASCAPVIGACCYSADGISSVTCSVELVNRCTGSGNTGLSGVYVGAGTACAAGACPAGTVGVGACCFNATLMTDIACAVHTSSHCSGSFSSGGLQGRYMGDGVACTASVCRPSTFNSLGACCYTDPANPASGIICTIQNATNCQNYPNGSNTNNTAPFTVGVGGVFRTGQCCQPNAATPPTAGCSTTTNCDQFAGACVHSAFNATTDVVCTVQVSGRCTRLFNQGGLFGVFAGAQTTCSPSIIAASAGACCYIPSGGICAICTIQPQTMCTQVNNGGLGGTFAGLGTTCAATPCDPHTGACCLSFNSCEVSCASNCTANGGTYSGDGTVCNPNPCGAPAGVCCRGATCTTGITSSGACSGSLPGGQTAGAFFATGTACNSGVVSHSPCCYADYNKVNGISVQDIFDFLGDWFAGSPYANVGGTGSGGTLSVQNIFDFLGNWFAGGC